MNPEAEIVACWAITLPKEYRRGPKDLPPEDFYQSVAVGALLAARSFLPSRGPFPAWASLFVKKEVFRARRLQRLLTPSLGEPEPLVEDPLCDEGEADEALQERVETLRRAWKVLAPKYQNSLAPHFLEGIPVPECARMWGVTRESAWRRIAVALRVLRTLCGVQS